MRISEKLRALGLRCRPVYSSSSVTLPDSKPALDGLHVLYPGSIRSSVAMRSPPRQTLAPETVVTGETRGSGQVQQHPGIAERVRFDVLEVQELGDARVVGAAQRVVGVVVDRRPLDLGEARSGEEVDVERQSEQAGQAELAGGLDQGVEQLPSDAVLRAVRVDGQRADLAQVGPEDVQGPAAD